MFFPLLDSLRVPLLQSQYDKQIADTGLELLQIQSQAQEQLSQQQADFIADCTESYQRQFNTLVNTHDFIVLQKIQFDYLQEMQESLLDFGRQQLHTAVQAQAAVNATLTRLH